MMAASLPPEKKGDVKCGAVQIYKLEEEHLQSKAVLPLRLCPWVFYRGRNRELQGRTNTWQLSGKLESIETQMRKTLT